MLDKILKSIKNYFAKKIVRGTFTIESGTIKLPFVQDGQYFRICESVFNDGVYQYPCYNLIDETFNGTISALAIPNDLLDLVGRIEKWQVEYGAVLDSPYQSESFGGYTYSKGSSNGNGTANWQTQFASELNRYRKI